MSGQRADTPRPGQGLPATDGQKIGLLLLFEAGVLSEGQVAKALGIDRVALRVMHEGVMAAALEMAEQLVRSARMTSWASAQEKRDDSDDH